MKTLSILVLLTSSILAADDPARVEEAPDGAPVEQAKFIPTRFVGEDADSYLASLKGRLAINRQDRCPFGLYQVPGETPIISSPLRRLVKKTPFSDYINQIQISIVNSKDKEFFVGARIFRLGQVFPIIRGGEKVSVKVESIESSRVSFKNLKTGEIAFRQLSVIPPGVTADAELDVPGVTPAGSAGSAALILEASPSPPSP